MLAELLRLMCAMEVRQRCFCGKGLGHCGWLVCLLAERGKA